MQRRSPTGAVCKGERDDELSLFHDMHRKQRDNKTRNGVQPLRSNAEPHFVKSLSPSLPPRMVSPVMSAAESIKSSKTGDDLLTADLGKNDYDWLLTPPGTPLVNPPDHHGTSAYGDDILSHAVLPNLVRSLAAIKTCRLSSSKSEPIMKESSAGGLMVLRPDPTLRNGRNGLHRSASGFASSTPFTTNSQINVANKRMPGAAPSSRPASRPTTPTKRSTVPSAFASRPSTPTSRSKAAPTPFSRPTTPTRSRAAPTPVLSRPSTPSNRSTLPSTTRNMDNGVIALSLPTRGSLPSRPTTPVRRPMTTAQSQTQSASATATRSSSVSKGRPVPPRSTPSSRGNSPTLKPNAWQQLSDIPGFSLEPPPNLRTSLSARPTSNSRGAAVGFSRPSAPASSSSDTHSDRSSDPSARRPSSPSLSRVRSASGTFPLSMGDRSNATSMGLMRNGGKFEKSPGEVTARGTNVAERMIQARRPFPSSRSPDTALSMSQVKQLVKPTPSVASKDGATNGRMIPRKSVDVPMRHMELRQGTACNGLRTLVRNIPTSSLYSVRPAGMRVFPNKSPIATSSNASSDYSMGITRDPEGSELGEELISEADSKASPMSQPDSLSSVVKDAHAHNWTDSPEYKDATPDSSAHVILSNEKAASCESSPVCRHGCVAASCELCNMKIRLQKLNEKCRASLTASLMCSEEVHKPSISNGVAFAAGHH